VRSCTFSQWNKLMKFKTIERWTIVCLISGGTEAIPNSKQAEARLSRPLSRGVAMGNIRALGTVGAVLYVLGGTFADIVWSAIAAVTVALLIATFREAMTWF
jgi:hypothetical protein